MTDIVEEITSAEIVFRYFKENPDPIPEGYELVTDGTTQEGDIFERTNTGSAIEKIIRQLRPTKRPTT